MVSLRLLKGAAGPTVWNATLLTLSLEDNFLRAAHGLVRTLVAPVTLWQPIISFLMNLFELLTLLSPDGTCFSFDGRKVKDPGGLVPDLVVSLKAGEEEPFDVLMVQAQSEGGDLDCFTRIVERANKPEGVDFGDFDVEVSLKEGREMFTGQQITLAKATLFALTSKVSNLDLALHTFPSSPTFLNPDTPFALYLGPPSSLQDPSFLLACASSTLLQALSLGSLLAAELEPELRSREIFSAPATAAATIRLETRGNIPPYTATRLPPFPPSYLQPGTFAHPSSAPAPTTLRLPSLSHPSPAPSPSPTPTVLPSPLALILNPHIHTEGWHGFLYSASLGPLKLIIKRFQASTAAAGADGACEKEARAYARLAAAASEGEGAAIAPRWYGRFRSNDGGVVDIVLERFGEALRSFDTLFAAERQRLLTLVTALHQARLSHDDLAPRNVLFEAATGEFRLCDLESSVEHGCPGVGRCEALQEFRREVEG
ncbi:hypothetical protein JCM6882_003977 [Rhodosporidiobolus microsporus]